ncbi:MAG: hypothetical protein ABS951_00330 [Solibacillus sp.]
MSALIQNVQLAALLQIGYPDATPKARERKPVADVLTVISKKPIYHSTNEKALFLWEVPLSYC